MTYISGHRLRHAVAMLAPEVNARALENASPKITEAALWQEMSCCVLSSQVPYEMAAAAASRVGPLLAYGDDTLFLQEELTLLLMEPLVIGGQRRRYRFPRSRARHLASARRIVTNTSDSLGELISILTNEKCMRPWLVAHIPGFGPKQASMFLRNIGATSNLAIIDRHIVRYMVATGLADSSGAPTTFSDYETRECSLRDHAQEIGHSLAVVDWSIWIVMRAASQLREL